VGGRVITVKKSESNKEKREHIGYTVHIKNISFKVMDKELREFCEKEYGKVKSLHLVKDDKGKSKGYGFIEFEEKVNTFNR
jgi:RNA recognition motif-containing protein